MIEQHGERLVVAIGAHRRQQIIQLVAFGRSIFAAGLKFVAMKPGRHARYPSRWFGAPKWGGLRSPQAHRMRR
jgi:hypothetical protein